MKNKNSGTINQTIEVIRYILIKCINKYFTIFYLQKGFDLRKNLFVELRLNFVVAVTND